MEKVRRTHYFGDVPAQEWLSPTWQHQHAIRSAADLEKRFPGIPEERLAPLREYEQSFRLQVTPQALELIEPGKDGFPSVTSPCWRQFFPLAGFTTSALRADSFALHGEDNWESAGNMPTPIGNHQYTGKMCLRFPGCLGYCTFCFEVRRVTSRLGHRDFSADTWKETLAYTAAHPEIEEVIFSGGEPLMCSNARLDRCLEDVRAIPSVRFLRLHTRAATFAPGRFDDGLLRILRKHRVDAVHLHVAHLAEVRTPEFAWVVDRLRSEGGIHHLRSHTPLLKGVNDTSETLDELFRELYGLGVDPYYLIHSFPQVPAPHQHRVPVRRGVELLLPLHRAVCHARIPEYVICHPTGKQTVPLTLESSSTFQYTKRERDGWPVVRYRNWRGELVEYLDCP